MTTDVSSVLLDTNVLLSATAPARDLHRAAVQVLDRWPRRDIELCVSGQVLREYLVVATRDPAQNGLGLNIHDALENVAAFAERSRFLAEGSEVASRLRALLQAAECSGKQIHDANLVATASVHEVPGLVTENVGDFERFEEHIELVPLASVSA